MAASRDMACVRGGFELIAITRGDDLLVCTVERLKNFAPLDECGATGGCKGKLRAAPETRTSRINLIFQGAHPACASCKSCGVVALSSCMCLAGSVGAGTHAIAALDWKCGQCAAWNCQGHDFFLTTVEAYPATPSDNLLTRTYVHASVFERWTRFKYHCRAASTESFLRLNSATP
jgi:hypothetical protein